MCDLPEGEVVAVCQEEVVPCQRRIALKLIMAIKTRLTASHSWVYGSASSGIATNREFLGHRVTIRESETQRGEQHREVIANVVDILLSVDKLVESDNAIMSQEVVVGRSIQSRAWAANIIRSWSDESMRFVTLSRLKSVSTYLKTNGARDGSYGCRNLITTLAIAGKPILSVVVWILRGNRMSRLVIRVERTGIWAARARARLLANGKFAVFRPWRLDAGHVGHPWEGVSSGEKKGEENGLHSCNSISGSECVE